MRKPLLSVRAALVLALAALVGVGAGALSALGGASPAEGVLYGAGSFGVAVGFFDCLIEASGPDGS